MMPDLVLAAGMQFFTLPNIKGQKYALGPVYPGEREGEEFIFTKTKKGLPDPTHGFIISVDDQGQYWVQNDTRTAERTTRSSVYNTFVNKERVEPVEIRLLKLGDRISLGEPATWMGPGRHSNVFCVKERTILWGDYFPTDRDRERVNGNGNGAGAGSFVTTSTESPFTNNLIVDNIMSYLPVKNLKSARLVCKKFKEEASKALEKRGMVSFTFNASNYENPENSTRVFRYLHEMRELKLRNLEISLYTFEDQSDRLLSPGKPGEKMLNDLLKLLKSSHNFTSLSLFSIIQKKSGFHPFFQTFQELGEKLVELKLDISNMPSPALPSLPLMSKLKKFTVEFLGEENPRWPPFLVPHFANNLEHFICWPAAQNYLQEFVKHPMPNLKGIAFQEVARARNFSTLLELNTPLTFLEIHYSKALSEPEELLEKLLLKHSTSLQHLVVRIRSSSCDNENNRNTDVRFPPFPKLEKLEVEYDQGTRITWENGLDYKDHFPSLRKLTVRPPEPWDNDDPVFNALFPDEGLLRCETVTEVRIHVLPNDSFQPRMTQIKKMFPKAEKINFLQ